MTVKGHLHMFRCHSQPQGRPGRREGPRMCVRAWNRACLHACVCVCVCPFECVCAPVCFLNDLGPGGSNHTQERLQCPCVCIPL